VGLVEARVPQVVLLADPGAVGARVLRAAPQEADLGVLAYVEVAALGAAEPQFLYRVRHVSIRMSSISGSGPG